MYFKQIILFSIFVFSVLGFEQNINSNKHSFRRGIPLKFSEIVKRSIIENSEEPITESTVEPKTDTSTQLSVDVTNAAPKDETNVVPKDEEIPTPKETVKEVTTKHDLNIKKEGEKIEREGENEERAVTPDSPKEEMTPSSATPLPPVSPTVQTVPTAPSVPSVTLPTVPTNRPVYPFQPEYPSSNFPNYWQNPNWGNWGRFVPTNTGNWGTRWPTFNSWPAGASIPSVPSVAAVPQFPSYSPSNFLPSRYSPFGQIPSSSDVPTFSFIVPQNPYGGGRGFQYPEAQPSVPTYSGFQPSYQPRFIPSGGPTQGLFPGVGGRTPGYYPSVGGQRPNYYPGTIPQTPRLHPGQGGQAPSGSDPKRPMGPMGPEFMDDSDVAMINPQTGNIEAIRIYPGNVRRNINFL